MNILFLTDNFFPERNAAASRVYERACYWVKWGHQVTVITCTPNFPEGKVFKGYKNKWYQVENIDGIRVVRIKTFIAANKGFFLRIIDSISFTIPAIIAGLFQQKPDVVVATSPSLFAAVAGLVVAKIRRLPFVMEVSDLWPASIIGVGAMKESFLIRCLEKLELFLYRHAASLIVLSPAFQENLISRNISADKIHVVINGVDMTRYYPRPPELELAKQYQITADHFVVGYIGTHGMAHALENILHSAELLKHQPNIKFLFVGAGAARDELMREAEKKALNNVCFVPSQAKEKIADFWSLCHIALVHLKNSPVFAEVIPSKIFEAMGMGLPIVIAAPAGVAVSIVEDDNVGVSVEPENPKLLAHTINHFFENPGQLEVLAKNSYKKAPNFSREQQAKNFILVLKQTLTTVPNNHE